MNETIFEYTLRICTLDVIYNYLGHYDNYIPANPLATPPHIVPEWYFLPFYGILRSVPDKFFGVFLLIFSINVVIVIFLQIILKF